jgi:hypothetical protein
MSSTTTNARKPRYLEKGVKNTLPDSTVVHANNPQRHVQVNGETRTICKIDASRWHSRVEAPDGTVTCPYCADLLKQAAQDAKAEAKKAAKASEATA